MTTEAPVEMFFFPYVGGGHQIPMIDMARLFAAHGATSTVITTHANALSFQNSILRDQQSGLRISIHALDAANAPEVDMSAPPFTDTSMLQEPLRLLLLQRRPDCIVADMFHRWSADVIDSTGVPRIVFNGNGCFSRCVGEMIKLHKPQYKVDSDSDPFLVPGLPDRIELTRSQLPSFIRKPHDQSPHKMGKSEEKSFGVVINSFRELEPAYADYVKNELEKRAWIVGPVSLCNQNVADKASRGQQSSIDEHSCLSWLDSKPPSSVLYISFGSLLRLAPEQLLEIAHGLEASGHHFIWVVGKIFKSVGSPENWLPDRFEERINESKKGLIIRGWAPQLLILEHEAIGGFMTHCGWNSTLEGVNAGKAMITFPMTAEQFYNEKLIVDMLKIGVEAGSKNWTSYNVEMGAVVGREKVEAAVKKIMGGGDEVAAMRRRAKELADKAKKAVEQGGSSYADADALIQQLKASRKVTVSNGSC